jgi:hypothetical protein
MRSLVHVAATLAVTLTSGGCSSASHPAPRVKADAPVQTAQAAQAVASPCIAVVSGTTLSSWQTVAGDGFTFCVPDNWHGRGHNWRTTASTLEWGTGKARGPTVKVVERRVVSRSELAAGVRTPSEPPAGTDIQRFTDQIDGRTVTLWRNRINGKFYVGGQWDTPQVWLVGQADDQSSADTQMMILRTVRFAAK